MKDRRILFRCDAGPIREIGTGHLARDLLLAEQMAARGASVGFCGHFDHIARSRILDAGHELIEAQADEPENELLGRAVVRFAPHQLVLDRLDTQAEDLAAVRSSVPVVVTLDDRGSGARSADVVINAMVGVQPDPYSGFDWAVVPPPDSGTQPPPVNGSIVLSLGGYDSQRLGGRIAKALAEQVGHEIFWIVSRPIDEPPPVGVTVLERPPDFSDRLRGALVAVVNGGLTMMEAVANGVPCVAVAQYDHQAHTIQRLARRGALISVETASPDIGDRVAEAVRKLLVDPAERRSLRRRALANVDGRGLARVTDLLTVVERLDWDSTFFGVEIARLYPARLTERLLAFALEEVKQLGSRCVYYLCDCHHAESVRLAESAGFRFVDIRLTLERSTEGGKFDDFVREARQEDLAVLDTVARHSYEYSRYYFDYQFSRADCERLYSDWLRKSVGGELADRVFVVADDHDEPVGYIAVSRETAATASISLLGVAEHGRGMGAAARLIAHAVAWAESVETSRIEVVTQGRNYPAQRAYQRAGFITAKNELWYHLWRH